MLGFTATYLLRHASIDSARKVQHEEFSSQTREVVLRVEQRLAVYEQMLHGVEGLFYSSVNVSREEFHKYVTRLHLYQHFPGIQSVGFSLIIPPHEKARHIEATRQQGYPAYTLRPPGERSLYTSIIFVEPSGGINAHDLGYDLYTEVAHRQAMDLARASDDAAMSGKIKLNQEAGQNPQSGFNMFMPVYRNGIPHESLEERRANIIGWAYASFRMNDLMSGILGEDVNKIDLEIWDGKDSSSNESLMYDNDGIYSPNLSKPSLFNSTQRIDFLGHSWTVKVRSLPAFESSLDTERATTIQLTGSIMSLLLSLFIWQLARSRAHALNLSQELRIAAAAFESQESLMITDANGVILRVNTAFTETTGFSAEDAVGQTPRLLKSGRHDMAFYVEMWDSLLNTGTWQGEIWDRRKNGEVFPKWLTISSIKGNNGAVTHYVGGYLDISERKAAEEKIKHLAFYDPLTQLPNRRLFTDRFDHALASSARSNQSGALLFIDLDNFKDLNDSLGHDIGDLLLQQVAHRIESCLREDDTVARMGGDEFVVLLENLSEHPLNAAAQAKTIVEKILSTLNEPYQLSTHECLSTPSIGVTLFNGHQQAKGELLKQADLAMYQAKKSGRNTVRFFDQKMQEDINDRVSLGNELHKAIENREFHLHYQIQVDSSHRPLGAEALIRWMHPENGMISPAQFIPLAEETGLILPVGKWVLETACAQLNIWQQDALTNDLTLSVNVSAKQFRHADFVAQVQAAVQHHAVKPKLLKLELTESLMLENIEDTIATMNALSAIGVVLSLDDFGTGYSSLQYLKRLPLAQLKIDQSFVRDITTDKNDEAIVRTIVAMAHSLNLDVIAEGVETEEQRQLLLNNGCTNYQGYLFSKPLPIEQFEALLKKQ